MFRLAGRIQRVELHTDKDGRSRGFAVIEYDHPVEAVQAISMFNNQYLFERQMSVRMDRNDNNKMPEGLKGIGMGLGSNGEPLKDVVRNLPSSNSQQSSSLSSGILGAVPNSALQVASALSGLNSINPAALSSLAGNAGVFQAGNLLGGADLSLASSLVSNQLAPGPFGVGNSSAQGSMSGFGRPDAGYGAGPALGNNRSFQNQYDGGNKATPFGAGFGNDRETTAYNSLSGNMRGGANIPKQSSGFSRKIIVSNVSILSFLNCTDFCYHR